MKTQPKGKRGRRGFICIVILVIGSLLFVLMAGITNTFFEAHKTNQDRLESLQETCDQMAPIRISQ